MKKVLVIMMSLILLAGCASQTSNESKYRIGVIQIAEHPSLDAALRGAQEYWEEKYGEDVEFVVKNAQGNVADADLIAQSMVSDKYDLIYAIGTNAAQSAFYATEGTGIPVVFNAVTDPVEAQLVDTLDHPGNNVTGVSDLAPADRQLMVVKNIFPNAKKVGIIYNTGEINSTVQIDALLKIAPSLGIDLDIVGISNIQDVSTVVTQMLGRVDAIYNITDNMVVSATSTITELATKKGIPVFASEDGQIKEGILAAESLSYDQLGRKAGEMIEKILINNVQPESLSVYQSRETTLILNQLVAEKFEIDLNNYKNAKIVK
ncbi:MAG: ABC transporter substrate-binding protein [Erysipelothrix sp.]